MPNHDQEYFRDPPVIMCRTCGKKLADTLIEQGVHYHVGNCDPAVVMERRNAELKQQLIDVITWVNDNSRRSMQVEIGPSEMGSPCDQRIARVMAGMPQVNFRMDPWPAIVGTSVHTWLEDAVQRYQKEFPGGTPVRKWQTEMAMMLDENIPGHSDLYTHEFDVVDHKNPGPSVFAKIKKGIIDNSYKIQGHLYGYGHEQAGRQVRDVVLVFYPRAGWLKDTILYREPYDRRIAEAAIERVYLIADDAIRIGVLEHPERWAQISTTPNEDCYMCPFFVDRPAEKLPDGAGCPGASKPAQERKAASAANFAKGLL